ncbi:hypothetical protein BRADO2746 [Bradyrhizobium sp. ORS 278]|nr:hypothetical protein BRADO2746 [Bradyrhizobium sp. ORS 278]
MALAIGRDGRMTAIRPSGSTASEVHHRAQAKDDRIARLHAGGAPIQISCAETPISSSMPDTSSISRTFCRNKSLPKISKSCHFSLRSGPDEGRTRRHETLGRQCGGRERISAPLGVRTNEAFAEREVAWSWHPEAGVLRWRG